ncbi:MAG: hypothetical protein HYX39_09985 [Bacteroidetes bacterium]|nr:hypothetical protein [Bacteroidota bacterium]
MKRVIIYPKDVMIITGKSESYSRDLLKKIKAQLNKEEHQYISVQEFCTYMGLSVSEINLQ